MIYLIKSAAYKNKECTEYEDTLKIGYTKDDSKKSRFGCYITENPTCQILYLIPEATEQDERNLHYHFRKYKKDYGQEWFSYEEEIINFFKTHTTKESLKELKPYHGKLWSRTYVNFSKERDKLYEEFRRKYITKVLSSTDDIENYPEIVVKLQQKLNELIDYSIYDNIANKVDEYFTKEYPDIDFSITESKTNISIDLLEIIKEIDNIKWFEDKMKYVYNLNLSPDQMKIILDNVSNTDLSKYYYSIPSSRAGSLNYRKTALEQEYTNQKKSAISFPQVEKEILERFLPGFKYSNVLIKEELKRIYSNNKYSKTPKASNLNEIFTVRKCKVQNSSGAWENGLEILGVK